jgi:hypothetical protein
MRVLIFTLLTLIAGLVSADDSYLCVAEKVTGFEFDKNSESWRIATIPADQYRFIVRPLPVGSESHKNGYRNVVEVFGDDGSEVALCRRNSDVYGGLNCGEPREAYKFNIREETMRFVMTFNGSYLTSNREVTIEGQDVIVKQVPDKGGKAPIMAIGQCSIR